MVTAIPAIVVRQYDKTAKCAYQVTKVHRFVGKIQHPKRFVTAHDARDTCRLGDRVLVVPAGNTHHARTKGWVVAGILQRAKTLTRDATSSPESVAAPMWPARWNRKEVIPFRLPRPRDRPRETREVRFCASSARSFFSQRGG
jgi:ribosomal protein S17